MPNMDMQTVFLSAKKKRIIKLKVYIKNELDKF